MYICVYLHICTCMYISVIHIHTYINEDIFIIYTNLFAWPRNSTSLINSPLLHVDKYKAYQSLTQMYVRMYRLKSYRLH